MNQSAASQPSRKKAVFSLLILLALFWIVWSRMGRERPLRARANPLDLPVFSFFLGYQVL